MLAAIGGIAFAGAIDARVPSPGTASETAASADAEAMPAAQPATRGMRNGLFISSRDPQFEMRVVPELKYVGKAEFDLKDTAHVERHHFVAVENGRVTRMLVLQFEEMLPTNDDIYRWTVKRPQTLGNQVYQFSTFVFSTLKAAQTNPEAEVARTQALLAEKNLKLDDELAVARFARVIGADRRREFIIFYSEPLRDMSRRLEDVVSGEEDISPAFENLAGALTERALASFSIAELPPGPPLTVQPTPSPAPPTSR
jgi:hypothetical protein